MSSWPRLCTDGCAQFRSEYTSAVPAHFGALIPILKWRLVLKSQEQKLIPRNNWDTSCECHRYRSKASLYLHHFITIRRSLFLRRKKAPAVALKTIGWSGTVTHVHWTLYSNERNMYYIYTHTHTIHVLSLALKRTVSLKFKCATNIIFHWIVYPHLVDMCVCVSVFYKCVYGHDCLKWEQMNEWWSDPLEREEKRRRNKITNKQKHDQKTRREIKSPKEPTTVSMNLG